MELDDSAGHRSRIRQWKRLAGQLSRYDLVLAGIPLVFAVALVGARLLSVPFHTAVAVSALASGVFVADGLYLNPPTGATDPAETADATRETVPKTGD